MDRRGNSDLCTVEGIKSEISALVEQAKRDLCVNGEPNDQVPCLIKEDDLPGSATESLPQAEPVRSDENVETVERVSDVALQSFIFGKCVQRRIDLSEQMTLVKWGYGIAGLLGLVSLSPGGPHFLQIEAAFLLLLAAICCGEYVRSQARTTEDEIRKQRENVSSSARTLDEAYRVEESPFGIRR